MESDVDGGACFHWDELGKNRRSGSPVGVLRPIGLPRIQLRRASLFLAAVFEHLLDWDERGHAQKLSHGG